LTKIQISDRHGANGRKHPPVRTTSTRTNVVNTLPVNINIHVHIDVNTVPYATSLVELSQATKFDHGYYY